MVERATSDPYRSKDTTETVDQLLRKVWALEKKNTELLERRSLSGRLESMMVAYQRFMERRFLWSTLGWWWSLIQVVLLSSAIIPSIPQGLWGLLAFLIFCLAFQVISLLVWSLSLGKDLAKRSAAEQRLDEPSDRAYLTQREP